MRATNENRDRPPWRKVPARPVPAGDGRLRARPPSPAEARRPAGRGGHLGQPRLHPSPPRRSRAGRGVLPERRRHPPQPGQSLPGAQEPRRFGRHPPRRRRPRADHGTVAGSSAASSSRCSRQRRWSRCRARRRPPPTRAPVAGYGSPSRYHSDYPSTEEGPAGTAYIYYRSTAPTNCALFYSNEPGAATTQSIRVCLERRSDGAKECDPPARGSGPYHTYAGPVFINAPGVCVKVYGTVDPTQGRSETVNSDWVRCR
jgi:hypothetical protein